MLIETLPILLTAWGLTACLMLGLWIVQLFTRNAGFVDIGWTLGLLICAVVYYVQVDGVLIRKEIVLVFVFLWAMRLAGLLIRRLLRDPSEDKRYQKIRSEWKTFPQLKFFFFFQFQGFLDVVLSVPFLLIMRNPNLHFEIIEVIAMMVWGIGYIGEMVADQQLTEFKSRSENRGKTCEQGLWNYSRHPNYFFEWTMWLAYFIFALAAPGGWLAVFAPILMYYFLMHVSGVPLAEAQALQTRGEEYRRYQTSTSRFVPWFRKHVAS